MPRLYLDPFLFSCPPAELGLEEFSAFIESLLTWKELKNNPGIPVFICQDTYSALAETNSYPMWPNLKEAIGQLGMVDVQPKDVIDLINSLLTKLPNVETFLHIDDILR